jgi:hypothetical protein
MIKQEKTRRAWLALGRVKGVLRMTECVTQQHTPTEMENVCSSTTRKEMYHALRC